MLSPSQQDFIPINQVRPALVSLLRVREVARPTLDVNYLNLSQLPGYTGSDVSTGVLIVQAGATSELEVGDIIISIEQQQLTRDNSLTQTIQQYQPGDILDVDVIRDGQRITLSLELN